MPSKRYILTYYPIDHINGKMANRSATCKNREGGGENEGFFYGYRKKSNPKSRYGVRTMSRNLTTKPYSSGELSAQNLFRTSAQNTSSVFKDLTIYNAARTEYAAQYLDVYSTLYGFIFSTIYKNNGYIPERWLS